MEKVFLWGSLFCIAFALLTHNAQALGDALLSSGGTAVSLAITLAGAYCLWCGVLEVMRSAGLIQHLADALRPLLHRLFPGVPAKDAAEEAIAENFAANLLGMGNAATPAGLRAMREMQRCAIEKKDKLPTHDMCLFLVLNNSSLQLVPTTLISLRAALGSSSPADIVLPALLSSSASTLSALLLCILLRGLCKEA